LGYKEALPQIIRFLDEPDVFVRAATAEALYLLDARETAPKLVPFLKDADYAVNRNTVRALLSWHSREIIPEIVKLLEDSELHVRMSALELLGALGAKEAAPRITNFLKDEVPYVRGIAADALCLLESREGIPVLLEEGMEQKLTALNKFRQPEVWERLHLKKLKQDLEGRGKEIEEQWSREAGVSFDNSRAVEALRLLEVDDWSRILSNGGRANLWEAMMESALSSYEFILERDRIRIVSRQEALAFWRKWWESVSPKDR
jgi:hypothetical protein